MSAGVVSAYGAIEATTYDLAVEDYHCPHRDLALRRSLLRQREGFPHEEVILTAVDDGQGAKAGHDGTLVKGIMIPLPAEPVRPSMMQARSPIRK
jgi:hypothetical protein